MVRGLLGRLRRASAARAVPDDEVTAELTADYWAAYDARMAAVGFRAVARRFPGLVGQAVRLGWSASRLDTAATITLNIASGVFTAFALFATTGVLEALFAAVSRRLADQPSRTACPTSPGNRRATARNPTAAIRASYAAQ